MQNQKLPQTKLTLTSVIIKVLELANTGFKYYVRFVFLWILVYAFSRIQLPPEMVDVASEITTQEASGGVGFFSLQAAMEVWKVLRNFGYLLILFIVPAMGLAYFLIDNAYSEKLKGQLISLGSHFLLLTFSYALAGLAIDVIYIAYYASIGG